MTHEQRSELMELATAAFHHNYELGRTFAFDNGVLDISELYKNTDPEFEFINFLYNIPLLEEVES